MTRAHRLDTRIGGHPRYVYCDEWALMQVPPDLLKCVCFIEVKAGGSWRLNGTAYLVSRRLEGVHRAVDPEAYVVYAVTAKHVLKLPGRDAQLSTNDEDDWYYDDARLVLNRIDGTIGTFPVPPEAWLKHPLSDTAVARVPLDQGVFDFMHYPSDSIVNGKFIKEWQIGPGEDVLMPGLLSAYPGTDLIQPIVRVGNLSAYTYGPIELSTGPEGGILVEVKSFGGLSGSPAFVSLGHTRRDDWGRGKVHIARGNAGMSGTNFLLGTVHGWFPDYETDDAHRELNTGITIVIPAARMAELLDSEMLTNEREEIVAEKNKRAPKSRLASVPGKTPASEEYERFEQLTQHLVNTPKPEKPSQ